eukprot:g5384.t1
MPSETKQDPPPSPSKAKPEAAPAFRPPSEMLSDSIESLEHAVAQKDERLMRSFLRQAVFFRRCLCNKDLDAAIRKYIPEGTPNRDFILTALGNLPSDVAGSTAGGNGTATDESVSPMEIEVQDKPGKAEAPRVAVIPELEIFFHMLVLSRSINTARKSKTGMDSCLESAKLLLERLGSFSRHTLDLIGSKVYILYSLVHELTDQEAFASIRPTLFRLYRTACLRRDDMGRATLVNLLLRNFISFDMYEQAGKLLDSIPEQFPSAISNNQFVRHLYYVGRVHAVNCEYGEAHQRLNV